MIKFHKRTRYVGRIRAKTKSVYSPSQRANHSTGTLRQLEMKLQTVNILHSISCFLFYAWSGEKMAKVNLWCLDVPKSSTLHQDLHLPLGPFAWTLIWADFQEAGTFCQSTTSGPEKPEGFLFLFFFLLLSLKLDGVKEKHSITQSFIFGIRFILLSVCCGGSRIYPKNTGCM